MPYFIDAHQDIAYNALSFGRDYTRPALETRRLETDTPTPSQTGQSLLGWPDYQRGQVGLIVATLFIAPKRPPVHDWETQTYRNPQEGSWLIRKQIDYYRRLVDEQPDKFVLVRNRRELLQALQPWEDSPAQYPEITHPVGLVMSLEGAEGLLAPEELEEFAELGLHLVGPVWGGGRYCGGTFEPGKFTSEGFRLLEVMAGLGYVLDISHMNEESARQALDIYPGTIIASHANARDLLKNPPNERHLSDRVIRTLAERGGVMGVLPYNRFLKPDWKSGDDRREITLDTLAQHIDHICQLTGSSAHVGIGTDFDGGFGWPAVPLEIDTIADLPKLVKVLEQRGYSPADCQAFCHGNWRTILERILP